MASFRGCVHSQKARMVQEVKEKSDVSYAEALRRVEMDDARKGGGRSYAGSVGVSGPALPVPEGSIVVEKEGIMAFMVEVVYGVFMRSCKDVADLEASGLVKLKSDIYGQ